MSRFLWGGRTAIVVALSGTIIGFVLGCCLGLVSAYRKGWVDELIGRTTDLALAFPALDPLTAAPRRIRHEYRPRRVRDRDHHRPRSRPDSARRDTGDRRPSIRGVRACPRRALELRNGGRDPAGCQEPAPRRLRPAADDRDSSRCRPQLRGSRASATGRRLGPDDRREPDRPQHAALARDRPGRCDRRPDDRRQPDHRRFPADEPGRPRTPLDPVSEATTGVWSKGCAWKRSSSGSRS